MREYPVRMVQEYRYEYSSESAASMSATLGFVTDALAVPGAMPERVPA